MAKVAVTKANLDDIGDAIREQLGTSETYTPSQMPGAIRSIPRSTIEVDPTLSVSGAAADARVTGQRLEDVEGDVRRLKSYSEDVLDDTVPMVADLVDVTGITPIVSFVGSSYIQTNVAVGETVAVDSPGSSGNFAYKIISCSPGDKITLNGTGGDAGRLWAFLTAGNVMLAKAGVNAQASNLVITAPANAAKCVLNMRMSTIGACYVGSRLSGILSELAAAVKALYPAIKVTQLSVYPSQAALGRTVQGVRLDYTCNVIPSAAAVNGQAIDVPEKSFSGSVVMGGLNLTDTTPFTLAVTDSRGDTDSKTVSLPFGNYIYFAAAAMPQAIDSAFIESMWDRGIAFSRDCSGTVFCGADEYFWFACPSRLGDCQFSGVGASKVATVSHTNEYGYTENYDVYRSTNAVTGQVSFVSY